MQTLLALDITETSGHAWHWRRRQAAVAQQRSADEPVAPDPDLPRGGFSSPLGYYFATAGSWTSEVPRLRVEFRDLQERENSGPTREDQSPDGASARRTARAHSHVPATDRARNRRASFPVTLEINDETARIGVNADTWESVRDAVLLVVAQFWRFGAIDRTLDELSDWARQDLATTTGFRSVVRPWRARDLRARSRTLQALILDLPDFEAALTNPRGCLGSGGAVRLYRTLAARLGLNRWRQEIDERIEVLEATFDSLAESLNHHQALAFQIALELIIVALLLMDTGLLLADALMGR